MFIRTKKFGNQTYYYLVETYREKDKSNPRQRVIKYLGKSKPTPSELERIMNEVKS